MPRRPVLLFLATAVLAVIALLFLTPLPALAADPVSPLASPWTPAIVTAVLDLVVVLVAFWIREGIRRRNAVMDERNAAVRKALEEVNERCDQLGERIALTREQYATKAEMRELDASIRASMRDTRQQLERRMDRQDAALSEISRELGPLRTDVAQLVKLLTR